MGDFSTVPFLSSDWVRYFKSTLMIAFPFSFVVDALGRWLGANADFWVYLCFAFVVNATVGATRHLIFKTFNPWFFMTKNATICLLTIVSYATWDLVRHIAGDNIAGEAFGKLIQISALLFPISKISKNVFILSKGKIPPEFIMRRLYNFEKNGDLKHLFEPEEDTSQKIDALEILKEELTKKQ